MHNTPLFTNPLAPCVFVFESNRAGTHNEGVAAFAKEHYGAEDGKGEGPTGKAYGIPTQNEQAKTLTLSEIKWHVDAFLGYARQQKDTFFQVTRVGCVRAGYKDEQIAPMFSRASQNVWLPGKWRLLLDRMHQQRGGYSEHYLDRARLIVYGPQDVVDPGLVEQKLTQMTGHWGKFEIVTEHMSCVGQLAERWARRQNYPTTPFVPHHDKFNVCAAAVLRQQMAWYSTHLIAFSDGKHNDTNDMINIANQSGLRVGVVECSTTAGTLEMLA